jgi:hypothetical protein
VRAHAFERGHLLRGDAGEVEHGRAGQPFEGAQQDGQPLPWLGAADEQDPPAAGAVARRGVLLDVEGVRDDPVVAGKDARREPPRLLGDRDPRIQAARRRADDRPEDPVPDRRGRRHVERRDDRAAGGEGGGQSRGGKHRLVHVDEVVAAVPHRAGRPGDRCRRERDARDRPRPREADRPPERHEPMLVDRPVRGREHVHVGPPRAQVGREPGHVRLDAARGRPRIGADEREPPPAEVGTVTLAHRCSIFTVHCGSWCTSGHAIETRGLR